MRSTDSEQDLDRLVQLLLRTFRTNFTRVRWKIRRSPKCPGTATTRTLETCDPGQNLIVLYPNNHLPKDGPLEQTTLHAIIHMSLMLSSEPNQERIVLGMERLLWKYLPKTYRRWLRRLVKESKETNGGGKKLDR